MSRSNPEPETARIVDTLMDGRGVADVPGKKVFVAGALRGETVRFRRRRKKRNFDEAELLEVLEPATGRVEPRCAVFGVCGGCSLQHLSAAEQLDMKQAVLLDNLERIGQVRPGRVLAPLSATPWGYRRKARLAVKQVFKKDRVLVGFRERLKPYVTDMQRCETLHPAIGERLESLATLIAALTIRNRIPQIECAVGDNATAMIFRVLDPPSADDLVRFTDWSAQTGIQVFLQPGGPETVAPLPGQPEPEPLFYRLPAFDVQIEFTPMDFLQVHADVNRLMIGQALDLLAPESPNTVIDLFSGLGNFSLPLARRAGRVIGFEQASDMVVRAGRNAQAAGLTNIDFRQMDLAAPAEGLFQAEQADLVLADPPRTGMAEMVDPLLALRPERLLYVSCHPGTLARDARRFVADGNYRLVAAGVMDMFPQTSHVESMALFER